MKTVLHYSGSFGHRLPQDTHADKMRTVRPVRSGSASMPRCFRNATTSSTERHTPLMTQFENQQGAATGFRARELSVNTPPADNNPYRADHNNKIRTIPTGKHASSAIMAGTRTSERYALFTSSNSLLR